MKTVLIYLLFGIKSCVIIKLRVTEILELIIVWQLMVVLLTKKLIMEKNTVVLSFLLWYFYFILFRI